MNLFENEKGIKCINLSAVLFVLLLFIAGYSDIIGNKYVPSLLYSTNRAVNFGFLFHISIIGYIVIAIRKKIDYLFPIIASINCFRALFWLSTEDNLLNISYLISYVLLFVFALIVSMPSLLEKLGTVKDFWYLPAAGLTISLAFNVLVFSDFNYNFFIIRSYIVNIIEIGALFLLCYAFYLDSRVDTDLNKEKKKSSFYARPEHYELGHYPNENINSVQNTDNVNIENKKEN